MMCVREDLVCSFKLLRPVTHKCHKLTLESDHKFDMNGDDDEEFDQDLDFAS